MGWSIEKALKTKVEEKKIVIQNKEFKNVSEACRFYNVDRNVAGSRIKQGWSLEEVFNLKKREFMSALTVNNIKFASLNHACKYYNKRQTSVNRRLERGWSIEEALEIVKRTEYNKRAGKIYKIINSVNDKIYIGYTTSSLKDRFNRHLYSVKSGSKTKLHKAIRKYGVEKFNIVLLKEISDRYALASLEIKYINKYNTVKKGYNSATGGNGSCGNNVGLSIIYEGVLYSNRTVLARHLGIARATLKYRIDKNLPLNERVNKK